jgi:hypothetical protein
VNDAVRLIDVGDGDLRRPAFGVGDADHIVAHRRRELSALRGFESRFTAALLDHPLQRLRIQTTGNDVISQNCCERAFVFGFEQGVHCSGRQRIEGGVDRREDREWPGALQRLDYRKDLTST